MIETPELRIGNYHGYRIFSNGRVMNRFGEELSHRLNDKGYPCVSLHVGGKTLFRRVHRLVAEVFIQNPENKPCVNHKDRNRANPNIENLEWVTHSENVQHSISNGGRKNYKRNNTGVRNANSRLKDRHISAIIDLHKIGYTQDELADIFDVTQPTISKILNGKLWKQVS